MTTGRPGAAFTSADAAATLRKACGEAGISGDDAELMRLGENAIFRLPQEGMVVRIARSIDVLADAEKEVAVASWLRDAGFRLLSRRRIGNQSLRSGGRSHSGSSSRTAGPRQPFVTWAASCTSCIAFLCHLDFPSPSSISRPGFRAHNQAA